MPIDATLLTFLFFAAVLTAMISSVAGVGGGFLLFGIMTATLDYALLVPIHGMIQITSCTSRVWFFSRDTQFRIMNIFFLVTIPSAILGAITWAMFVEVKMAQPYLKIAIATYLLLYLADITFHVRTTDRRKLMAMAGIGSGFLSITAGSPAPYMAPFFMAAKLPKNAFIGTWALANVILNGVKLPLFFYIWDDLTWLHGLLIVHLGVGSLLGTYLGKRISGRVGEELFHKLFVIIMLVLTTKLIVWDGLRVIIFG